MSGRQAGVLSELTRKQRLQANAIIREILKRRRVTRTGLAHALGLSASSIVKYVKALLDMGLLRETGKHESAVGRRSSVIELDPDVGVNIAVLLDLDFIQGALVNSIGEPVKVLQVPVHFGIDAGELIERIYRTIEALVAEAEGRGKRIFGIGIGLGGSVDQNKGISCEYRYATGWDSVPLRSIVEERFRHPCFLIHDVNAVALGEKYYGFGIGVKNFLSVWIAEGVSMGIVVNEEVYLGSEGFLGEFGHIQAVDGGPLCYCGHAGCLETVTKEKYILARCAEGLGKGVNSEVLRLCGNDPAGIAIDHVKKAAENGDRFCKGLFEEVAHHLGSKLSDIINVLNPALVTFRGSVIDGNRFLFQNIERIALNRSLRNISNSLKMRYAGQDEAIRLRGIGSWILLNSFGDHPVEVREG
jgi:N-acetylglucosamine repressor